VYSWVNSLEQNISWQENRILSEELYLLGCNAAQFGKIQTLFHRNISLPSSGSELCLPHALYWFHIGVTLRALKMEAIRSSITSADFHRTIRHYTERQSMLWEAQDQPTVSQLVKIFPALQRTRNSLPCPHESADLSGSIQSTPLHPTSLKSILILFVPLLLSLPNGLCFSGFATKILLLLYDPLVNMVMNLLVP
jgi:hypothetical protein